MIELYTRHEGALKMKSTILYTSIALTLLFLSACKSSDEELPDYHNPFKIEEGAPALIVAHRGGRNLKPENTLVAFDHAVALNVDVLEMDVCLTKDGILVTIHDTTVDRTCDTTGRVSDFTYSELRTFNFGYHFQDMTGSYPYRDTPVRIPKLEDIFVRYPDEYMMIEIKNEGETGKLAADKLYSLISAHGMARKVIAFSFSYQVMDHFHSINSDRVFTGASGGDGFNFVMAVQQKPDTLLSLNFDVFAVPTSFGNIDITDTTLINAVHNNGLAIHYWTINDKDEMKMLIERGADGIITDRPDLMKEALTELGF